MANRLVRRLLRHRLLRFHRDEEGSLSIFSLFIFVAMFIAGGMAVDFMRYESERAIMQSTLDSAVLAAADLDQELDAKAVVLDYFARSGIPEDRVRVEVEQNLNGREVSARASVDMDTFFIHMVGVDELDVVASGAAREIIPHVEISLVLDISGSMRFGGRMDNLKDAAVQFVSATLREEVDPNTSINVVPYAGQVNVGPEMFDLLGGERDSAMEGDFFPPWAQDISNIVVYFDRDQDGVIDAAGKVEGFPGDAPRDADEIAPSLIEFVREADNRLDGARVTGFSIKGGTQQTRYFAIHDDTNGPEADDGPTHNTGRLPYDVRVQDLSYDSSKIVKAVPVAGASGASCLELDADEFEHSGLPADGSYEQVPHFMYWPIADSVMDWGWCPEDDTAIQYARNDEAELHDFIRNIRMHDGTGTHYGMKYAVALLDPSSQAIFDALADEALVPEAFRDRPASWDEDGSAKYVVLMTDGKITEQVRPADPSDPENAVEELQSRPKDDRIDISSRDTNVRSFLTSCALARSLGVTVYTIAYEVNDSSTRREMQSCASSPSHYFDVSGKDISDAFSAIAGQINQLRLIQ